LLRLHDQLLGLVDLCHRTRIDATLVEHANSVARLGERGL
jgi:hypothetical protein